MNHTDEPPSSSVALQVADDLDAPAPLTESQVSAWASAVARATGQALHLTARIVTPAESRALNHTYRGKDHATNVLSFPFEPPPGLPEPPNYTGDLALCAGVIAAEAQQQNKPLNHHWAHMIVHGSLHLLGYDHIEPADADTMEQIEILVLQTFDITDPYQTPGEEQS